MSVNHKVNEANSSSLYALDLAGLERGYCKKNEAGYLDPEPKYAENLAKQNGLISKTFAKQDFAYLSDMRKDTYAPNALPMPEFNPKQPKTYPGTCADLVRNMKPAVDSLIDTMDYNPLNSYVQVIDQMEEGKRFQECDVFPDEEIEGSTCCGMSKAIVKLMEKHQIEARVADKHEHHQIFAHSAAVVLCTDGWVLIESSLPAEKRYFSVLFKDPYVDKKGGFSIRASKEGGHARLICEGSPSYEGPAHTFEYLVNIANSDRGVMKNFVIQRKFAPITAYQPGQTFSNKVICLYIDEERIEFEDRTHPQIAPHNPLKQSAKDYVDHPKYLFTKTKMSFEDVLKDDFQEKLEAFAGTDYKTPIPILHGQIRKIASKKGVIAQAFRAIHRR